MQELSGKVAVITGAASGIGRALAHAAHERGMQLALADIDGAALEATSAALSAQGAKLLAVTTDVGLEAEVERLAARVYEQFGAAHLLVNNAGVAYANSAWETPVEDYERSLRVNLWGVIHGVRAFVPRMLRAGEPGHVVNVASAAGLVAVPAFAAYSAAKFAVAGFSEALVHDLAARDAPIGVSLVCPSWVRTPLAERAPMDHCDGPVAEVRRAVVEAVRSGMAPEKVASQVFAAVVENRFYVLTHKMTRTGVRVRAEDIVEGRPPTRFPIT